MSVTFPYPGLAAIGLFVETLFCHADAGGYVSLRCFRDDVDGSWNPAAWSAPRIDKTGLAGIITAAGKLAAAAAAAAEKVVFAPPVATFAASTAGGVVVPAEYPTSKRPIRSD